MVVEAEVEDEDKEEEKEEEIRNCTHFSVGSLPLVSSHPRSTALTSWMGVAAGVGLAVTILRLPVSPSRLLQLWPVMLALWWYGGEAVLGSVVAGA